MKARKYHSLLVMENGRWTVQFGDYDVEVVECEKDEYEGMRVRTIKTNDDQASIDAKVAELNAKLKG